MTGIAAIGEVMIELAPHQPPLVQLGYAGDTYNTAVYLARHGVPVTYYTHLGTDAHSHAILNQLIREGVDTSSVRQHADRVPGLYMIDNQANGERTFTYWRDQSAARQLFSDPAEQLGTHTLVYLSAITLAIISPAARERLFHQLIRHRKAGGQLAFDSNFRLRLWPDLASAQRVTQQFLAIADIALLTLDDEQQLWAEHDAACSLARLQALALPETVIKCGAEPALISLSGAHWQPVPVVRVDAVVDTTAAGDAFNAGYLAARYQGQPPAAAVRSGALCAGSVIQHRGAIIAREDYQATHQQLQRQAQ